MIERIFIDLDGVIADWESRAIELLGLEKELTRKKLKSGIDFEEIVKSAPVAKIVFEIIRHAVEAGASDIHIEPYEKEVSYRFRINGVMQEILKQPIRTHAAVSSS